MKIQWKIIKKRGNLRPTLTYSFVVEDYEKGLAIPPVRIDSYIAEPINSWQEHCYPKEHERAATPTFKGMYSLEIVVHKGNGWPQTLRLPWREDNYYPEIEESFMLLREAFERELALADASLPMEEESFLNVTDQTSQAIAPTVLAEKFLHFAKRSSGIM